MGAIDPNFEPVPEIGCLGLSLTGLAIALTAGTAVYNLANQPQVFRVSFIAGAIIGTVAEITLHLSSVYRINPNATRVTLGMRNFITGLVILGLYDKILRQIESMNVQNAYATNVAILSGLMVSQLGSHAYSLYMDFDAGTIPSTP